jgi:osmotically-inducible protein OsmY
MKSKALIATVLLAVALPLTASDYSSEIEKEMVQLLSRNPAYKQVTFSVEDEIVTLAGKVPLWSNRTDLEWSVRRVGHVRKVLNQVVLDPPAVPDEVLRGRMKRALTERGFAQIKFQAHEGRVVLTGATRTRSQWTRIQDLAWSVEGVREVVNRIRVLEE